MAYHHSQAEAIFRCALKREMAKGATPFETTDSTAALARSAGSASYTIRHLRASGFQSLAEQVARIARRYSWEARASLVTAGVRFEFTRATV